MYADVNLLFPYLKGAAQASLSKTGHPLPTKVPSISTAENKAYNITGSHEVTGSSTDGSSAAGKSGGNLSLDALAKAKKALQMQKELAEKLKKIPSVSSFFFSFSPEVLRVEKYSCCIGIGIVLCS